MKNVENLRRRDVPSPTTAAENLARVLPVFPVFAVLVGTAACGGAEEGTDVVRRDSAGVEIVENSPVAEGSVPVWRVGGEPRLEIGTVEGPEATRFHRALDATRLPDGSIVVANTGSSEIRIFGSDGRHLGSYGSEGEGPGEFQAPYAVERLSADTLLVWDGSLRRISLLTTDGRLLHTARHEVQLPNALFRGLLQDRTFFVTGWYFDVPETGFAQSHTRMVRLDLDGQVVDTAGRYPHREMGRLGSRGMVGAPTFAPRTSYAVTGDGFWVGTARGYQAAFHAPDGELARIVRWDGPDRRVTEALVEDFRTARTEGREGEELRRIRRELEEHPVVERHRAYEELVTDDAGHLWVRSFERPGSESPHRWTVFDATGRLVARARTPRRLQLHEIGTDYVLGTWQDDLGVERIRLYRLDRGDGAE